MVCSLVLFWFFSLLFFGLWGFGKLFCLLGFVLGDFCFGFCGVVGWLVLGFFSLVWFFLLSKNHEYNLARNKHCFTRTCYFLV